MIDGNAPEQVKEGLMGQAVDAIRNDKDTAILGFMIGEQQKEKMVFIHRKGGVMRVSHSTGNTGIIPQSSHRVWSNITTDYDSVLANFTRMVGRRTWRRKDLNNLIPLGKY